MAEQNFNAKIGIERVYLRKLVYEPKDVPAVFDLKWHPNVKLDIQARNRSLGGHRHEVALVCTLSAEISSKEVLSIELDQAGIFLVEGVEGPPLHHILGVICPNILFPYVREAIDNVAVKGALPPFALAPVNFEAMLKQAMTERKTADADFSDEVLN